MWKYAISGEGFALTDLSSLSPGIMPLPDPPVGIDMPPLQMTEDAAPYGGSVVSSSRRTSRVIAITFAIVANSLSELSDLRRELHALIHSNGNKILYAAPDNMPLTTPESNFHIKYRTIGSETRITGPFSCEVTYRLHTEWTGWRRLASRTIVNVQNEKLSPYYGNAGFYNFGTGGYVDFYQTLPDPYSVVAYSGLFWICCYSGYVAAYDPNGASPSWPVFTKNVPGVGVADLVVFKGKLIARADYSPTLFVYNGASFVPWGPNNGGTGAFNAMNVSADGQLLLVAGSFTSPRKLVMALDENGNVAAGWPEVFPSATGGDLRDAIAVDGMALYTGTVGSTSGVWCGPAYSQNPQLIVKFPSGGAYSRLAGKSFDRVYLLTLATWLNGSPTGGLVCIRSGSAIRPVAEGVAPLGTRMRLLEDGCIWVVCSNTLYRLVDDGIQVVAKAGQILSPLYRDVARMGNKVAIIGNYSETSKIINIQASPVYTSPSVNSSVSRWIARVINNNDPATGATVLSIWRDFDKDVWTFDPSIPQYQKNISTVPSESETHGSATNWKYGETYSHTGNVSLMIYSPTPSPFTVDLIQEFDVI